MRRKDERDMIATVGSSPPHVPTQSFLPGFVSFANAPVATPPSTNILQPERPSRVGVCRQPHDGADVEKVKGGGKGDIPRETIGGFGTYLDLGGFCVVDGVSVGGHFRMCLGCTGDGVVGGRLFFCSVFPSLSKWWKGTPWEDAAFTRRLIAGIPRFHVMRKGGMYVEFGTTQTSGST